MPSQIDVAPYTNCTTVHGSTVHGAFNCTDGQDKTSGLEEVWSTLKATSNNQLAITTYTTNKINKSDAMKSSTSALIQRTEEQK